MNKSKIAAAAAASMALAIPATAGAHVTVAPQSLPAEGYGEVALNVPHGCEDAPTTKLTVKMPDQVIGATPQEVAGWRVTTREGKLPKPAEAHGERITEGVREITWTATGAPLDPHHFQKFGIVVNLAGTKGETAYFKAVQQCEGGDETAWIEIPAAGATEEPEHPAPAVALTAAGSEHGSAASAPSDGGDGGTDTISIVALIVGALGLGAGATALVLGRRR